MKHVFVEYIPEELAQDTIYISIPYAIAAHLCCCGCGNQVITPLSPTGWTLSFNGTISLDPSIGNWSFRCQSHYWIRNDKVVWARRWSAKEIAAGRANDRRASASGRDVVAPPETRRSWWDRFRKRHER